jgi:alpha/beta superfamily hydrolase
MTRLSVWLGALLLLLPRSDAALAQTSFAPAPTLMPTAADNLATLRQQSEQQSATTPPPLQHFLQPELLEAQPLRPLMSPDGQWLVYWRKQGFAYWLCRSRGDGEEQVLLKQRQPPPPSLLFSADQQGLWLGAADLLQYVDLARQQTRTLWQPGLALPGIKQLPARALSQMMQLSSHGGILQWQRDNNYQYWLLTTNQTAQLLHEHPQPLQQLWLGSDKKARLLMQFSGPRFDSEILLRAAPGTPFKTLLHCPAPTECTPLAQQHDQLWLRSDLQRDGKSLLALRHDGTLSWPQAATNALLSPDLTTALFSADGALLASAWQREQLIWQGHTAAWQQLLPRLQALSPHGSMQLQLAKNGKTLLVSFSFSDQPQLTHWRVQLTHHSEDGSIQISSRQQLQLLPQQAQERPSLRTATGSRAQFIVWPAADGQPIPGYLYLPPGRPLAQSPIIAMPHGGPFAQHAPDYDLAVQLLVSRGFIVLQPDYRSSTGYGQRFLTLAQGQFGLDSPALTDVLSGLDWLLQHGIGDAKQQAMIGHSFGAYLTLQGLLAQPQRFRFGLAMAAPVDLAQTFNRYVPSASRNTQERPLALALVDAALPWQASSWQQQMQRGSPLAQLGQLQRPVFLWQGALDDRIDPASVHQFWQQAQQLNKPVRLWLDPTAAHQPASLQSRQLQLYLLASISLSHLSAAALSQTTAAPAAPANGSAGSTELFDQQLQALEISVSPTGN